MQRGRWEDVSSSLLATLQEVLRRLEEPSSASSSPTSLDERIEHLREIVRILSNTKVIFPEKSKPKLVPLVEFMGPALAVLAVSVRVCQLNREQGKAHQSPAISSLFEASVQAFLHIQELLDHVPADSEQTTIQTETVQEVMKTLLGLASSASNLDYKLLLRSWKCTSRLVLLSGSSHFRDVQVVAPLLTDVIELCTRAKASIPAERAAVFLARVGGVLLKAGCGVDVTDLVQFIARLADSERRVATQCARPFLDALQSDAVRALREELLNSEHASSIGFTVESASPEVLRALFDSRLLRAYLTSAHLESSCDASPLAHLARALGESSQSVPMLHQLIDTLATGGPASQLLLASLLLLISQRSSLPRQRTLADLLSRRKGPGFSSALFLSLSHAITRQKPAGQPPVVDRLLRDPPDVTVNTIRRLITAPDPVLRLKGADIFSRFASKCQPELLSRCFDGESSRAMVARHLKKELPEGFDVKKAWCCLRESSSEGQDSRMDNAIRRMTEDVGQLDSVTLSETQKTALRQIANRIENIIR